MLNPGKGFALYVWPDLQTSLTASYVSYRKYDVF